MTLLKKTQKNKACGSLFSSLSLEPHARNCWRVKCVRCSAVFTPPVAYKGITIACKRNPWKTKLGVLSTPAVLLMITMLRRRSRRWPQHVLGVNCPRRKVSLIAGIVVLVFVELGG